MYLLEPLLTYSVIKFPVYTCLLHSFYTFLYQYRTCIYYIYVYKLYMYIFLYADVNELC